MRSDRLTRIEIETLQTFANGADWICSNRAKKAMRRLEKRGFAQRFEQRVFPSINKGPGFMLTLPAGEILERFGHQKIKGE